MEEEHNKVEEGNKASTRDPPPPSATATTHRAAAGGEDQEEEVTKEESKEEGEGAQRALVIPPPQEEGPARPTLVTLRQPVLLEAATLHQLAPQVVTIPRHQALLPLDILLRLISAKAALPTPMLPQEATTTMSIVTPQTPTTEPPQRMAMGLQLAMDMQLQTTPATTTTPSAATQAAALSTRGGGARA